MIVFCDIDWTLADCGHRVVTYDNRVYVPGHFFDYNDVNWRVFNKKENILKDTVFPKSIESIQKLSEVHTLIYVTSRERKTITATTEWLWRHGFPYGKVFCCTENNSKIISNKEYVFARYKDEILKQNAVMYDDDFSGKLHQIVSKYNIKLLQPDYVFGKKGFWLKEHKRLQKRNWKP